MHFDYYVYTIMLLSIVFIAWCENRNIIDIGIKPKYASTEDVIRDGDDRCTKLGAWPSIFGTSQLSEHAKLT